MQIITKTMDCFEIDDFSSALLIGMHWRTIRSGRHVYAANGRGELLHRILMNAGRGQHVDHIDGDSRNNRRANLRLCTHAENMRNRAVSKANRTGFKNVMKEFRHGRSDLWVVVIVSNKKRYRKRFASLQEAIAYANVMRPTLQGDFAPAIDRTIHGGL